jgi:hypothetical protein
VLIAEIILLYFIMMLFFSPSNYSDYSENNKNTNYEYSMDYIDSEWDTYYKAIKK